MIETNNRQHELEKVKVRLGAAAKVLISSKHPLAESRIKFNQKFTCTNVLHCYIVGFQGDILAQIRDLILQCDQTMRNVTVAYFQLQHTVTAPLPVQVPWQLMSLFLFVIQALAIQIL